VLSLWAGLVLGLELEIGRADLLISLLFSTSLTLDQVAFLFELLFF
jgi:hypothetical protein